MSDDPKVSPATGGPEPSDDGVPAVAPAADTPQAPRRQISGVTMVLIAGGMLIVAAGAFVLARGSSSDATEVASPKTRTSALPESAPIDALKVEPLRVKTVARSASQARERKETSFAQAFDAAIKPYVAGNYAAAVAWLQDLTVRFPESPEPPVYAGVSHLLLGHPQQAIDLLNAAAPLTRSVFAEDISWYLALAYRSMGRSDASLMQLRSLCAIGGEYGSRACIAVREIESRYRTARETAR